MNSGFLSELALFCRQRFVRMGGDNRNKGKVVTKVLMFAHVLCYQLMGGKLD